MTAPTPVMQSQNGWPCITDAASPLLREWYVGPIKLVLRAGPAGFILAHNALWFHEEIERLWPDDMPDYDDHGWGQRYIGTTTVPSNHWAAVAKDLNAKRHPQGMTAIETFTAHQVRVVQRHTADRYEGVLFWGANFRSSPDPMHFEFTDRASGSAPERVNAVALKLVETGVGRRLIAAQPKPVLVGGWTK